MYIIPIVAKLIQYSTIYVHCHMSNLSLVGSKGKGCIGTPEVRFGIFQCFAASQMAKRVKG